MTFREMATTVAALCAAAAVTVVAQTDVKSKIKVKDGQNVEVTGCVASAPSGAGNGYVLTHVADPKGSRPDYMLVADEDDSPKELMKDLAKHVGHRMEIKGKATDRDAKIEIETKTKTKVAHGDDQETHTKSTQKGDLPGAAYLSVKSMKMLAPSCP